MAKIVCIRKYAVLLGGFPVKNTVHTPYVYGSGQPYLRVYRQYEIEEARDVDLHATNYAGSEN